MDGTHTHTLSLPGLGASRPNLGHSISPEVSWSPHTHTYARIFIFAYKIYFDSTNFPSANRKKTEKDFHFDRHFTYEAEEAYKYNHWIWYFSPKSFSLPIFVSFLSPNLIGYVTQSNGSYDCHKAIISLIKWALGSFFFLQQITGPTCI